MYYDKGLNVLEASTASLKAGGENPGLSVAEAIESGKVRVVDENPPAGLFGHTGEVLVEHEGEGLLVDEDKVEAHLGHGDEVLDPTGRSGAEAGRR